MNLKVVGAIALAGFLIVLAAFTIPPMFEDPSDPVDNEPVDNTTEPDGTGDDDTSPDDDDDTSPDDDDDDDDDDSSSDGSSSENPDSGAKGESNADAN